MTRQGNKREATIENIKSFWENEAEELGDEPTVTIRDHCFRILEINKILSLIGNPDRLLDAGCGTGFSTLFYAQQAKETVGFDYTPKMIEQANKLLEDEKYRDYVVDTYAKEVLPTPEKTDGIEFKVDDVTEIHEEDESFDVVVAERLLINLPDVKDQAKAFSELSRVLKPGGDLILVEVTQDGHDKVDHLRTLFGLSQLEKYWHNLYLNEGWVREQAEQFFSRVGVYRFGIYQFLSKVLYPLCTLPDEPIFYSYFNKQAMLLNKFFLGRNKVSEEDILRVHFLNMVSNKMETREIVKGVLNYVFSKIGSRDVRDCSHQVLFHLTKEQ